MLPCTPLPEVLFHSYGGAVFQEGLIHKCSVSYNEQYIESVDAHSGPVYAVKCSPFVNLAALSASADWTTKLWNFRTFPQQEPIVYQVSVFLTVLLLPTFLYVTLELCCAAMWQAASVRDIVADVAWSPHHSGQFASVTGDGHIQVWDVRQVCRPKSLLPSLPGLHYPLHPLPSIDNS